MDRTIDGREVPWRLSYDYLSNLDDEGIDDVVSHLASRLGTGEPRDLQRWQDFESWQNYQDAENKLIEAGQANDASIADLQRRIGRPGLTHPRPTVDASRVPRAELLREFRQWEHEQFLAVEAATNGYMVNPEGVRRGISHMDLLTGDVRLVHRYATDELLDWFEQNPRMSFSEYAYERTGDDKYREDATRTRQQNRQINRDRKADDTDVETT